MDLALPERVPLARTPTPLERLDRISNRLAGEAWVKRDDLTGMLLSGNKVRKLEFLAAEARAAGAQVLVTCGAANSNHARATAGVAARLGLASHLLLRGSDEHPPRANLLLDRLLGAEVTFFPPEGWPERDARMREIARRLTAKGRTAYVIPEGGSNATGSLGYALAAQEVLEQAAEQGVAVRRLVVATGSGGTTAGLALGLAALGRTEVELVGVAVCDDRAYFDARIAAILDEAVERGFATPEVRARARWTILEGYKGHGYAKTTPEEMEELARLARLEGLVLDPVYTLKAFRGLEALMRQDADRSGGVTVFVHTGGLFGLFAYAAEVDALEG